MIWIIIIGLLLVGLVLLVVEVVFVPGTTVVGVVGVTFSIIGIMLSYHHFGNDIGLTVLIISLIGTAIGLYFSFKSQAWNAFALKSAINSKVNEGQLAKVKLGDEGFTVSALRPSGNAEFGNETFEVRTSGSFVEPGKKIKIILIEANQIIVELIN